MHLLIRAGTYGKPHLFLMLFFLIFVVLTVPVNSPGATETLISGQVAAGDGGPVAGVVMIEKGRLYGKNFRYGGLIDKDGRFSVRVDGGGNYGLHLYATGYVYFPLGIKVEQGENNENTYKLPPNPASDRAPVISNITFEPVDGMTLISFKVDDPDNDLSHQVLALNAMTGEAFRMSPPGFVLPFQKMYPDGLYTLKYSPKEGVASQESKPESWYFVAADNRCYNSPVRGFPFTEDGVVQARSGSSTEVVATGGIVSGEMIFNENCGMCHYADSNRSKVGPGFKGLFKMDKTPVQNIPVTEDNIRKQIVEGGENMPPYSYLSDDEIDRVVEYLKIL